jgi:hypothetical protein
MLAEYAQEHYGIEMTEFGIEQPVEKPTDPQTDLFG